LQYEINFTLSSTATILEQPLTHVEREEARIYRQIHVQDLDKYRTDAANKYYDAISKVAKARDKTAIQAPIIAGDLVMRNVQPVTKLHSK
jgi:hypothetical protein